MTRRSRALTILASSLVATVLLASAAVAAIVTIGPGGSYPYATDPSLLSGGGSTLWNATNTTDHPTCDLIDDSESGAMTPVEDGSAAGGTDAFDGGFLVKIAGKFFQDPDGNGALVDSAQLTAGPAKMSKVRVSTQARALEGSPTLRYLITLKNPGAKKTITVTVGSDVGSDEGTGIVGTSSGDTSFTTSDHWVVTNGDLTDPPVTQVLSGKKASHPIAQVRREPGQGSSLQKDCTVVTYNVPLPEKATRRLLLFSQMHPIADHDDYSDTLADAAVFDDANLNNQLLVNLTARVKGQIVNWNL